ncbi:MAG: hypothetical protein RLZZ175_1992 [Bacteroidota bacterium]|jgi:hypothetical protein
MKYILNLFVLSIFCVCNNNDNKKATYTNKNIITLKSTNRIDSLVNHYIKTTNNELVKINKKILNGLLTILQLQTLTNFI